MKSITTIGFFVLFNTTLFLSSILISCGQSKEVKTAEIINSHQIINPVGKTIESRINTIEGYVRKKYDVNSFENYLRTLPLKPDKSKVLYYDGDIMSSDDVYVAVVDLEIGNKDLQQCADAVIRLRAEYLYKQKLYDMIHFNFTNGFRVDYTKWAEGYRITVSGNKAAWVKSAKQDYSYNTFRAYLDMIFNYAGTLSLSKELKTTNYKNLKIGDVFIHGGSPGHAEIVVDVAINSKTGKKIFMLAQSFMPAQDIHIVKNPTNSDLSPWYDIEYNSNLMTPEYMFQWNELKSFE